MKGACIMTQKPDTQFVQTGNKNEDPTGAISPPVYFSTPYRREGLGASTGYDYTRTGNPTRDVLEESIASIEKGDHGFAFSSGMAAIHTVMSLFERGDELIVSEDLYGGTYRLFEEFSKKYGIVFHYWGSDDLSTLQDLITSKTKAIYVETPTNPLMQVADLKGITSEAKSHDLLVSVDNTLYTP